MIGDLGMTVMAGLVHLTRFQILSFIQSFILFICILVWFAVFLVHDVGLGEALNFQTYGFHDTLGKQSCNAGRGSLEVSAPSEISCVYHCSSQLQYIGAVYNSANRACICCSDIAEHDVIQTEDEPNYYTISRSEGGPHDCGSLAKRGPFKSGIYKIYLNSQHAVDVYCDFDDYDGPWTVIQRRVDGKVHFDRKYKSYQEGFGNLSGSFWLGLDTMSTLTLQKNRTYSLKVVLVDTVVGKKFAKYSQFAVMNSNTDHRLLVRGYSGNAGNSLEGHTGMAFTTRDRDMDKWSDNCAKDGGGGWWFARCFYSALNGRYDDFGFGVGIYWMGIGRDRSANFSEMKVKENE